jgi:hypothetical protein
MKMAVPTALMEHMTEGVILLTIEGQMTDFNRAAKPWLKTCLAAATALGELIGQARAAKLQLPVSLDAMFRETSGGAHFYLFNNEPNAFAIFITASTPAPAPGPASAPCATATAGKDSIFSLFSEDFRHELTGLRMQLAEAPVPADSANHLVRVRQQSLRLSRMLMAMEQLCELHEQDAFFQSDRVNLGALIESTIASMPTRRSDFSVNHALSDLGDKQGMLFGDASWLGVALKALLEEMVASAPLQFQIEIRVRQSGGFVVMTGQSSRFFDRGPVPVAAGKPAATGVPTTSFGADIRIAICQRIVALHGGQLKIVALDANQPDHHLRGMESFSLTLPTGAPLQGRRLAACTTCLAPRQAEQYAQDLAALLPQLTPGQRTP